MGTFIYLSQTNSFQDTIDNGVFIYTWTDGTKHYFGSVTNSLYRFARVGEVYYWISNDPLAEYYQVYYLDNQIGPQSGKQKGNTTATVYGVTLYYNMWAIPVSVNVTLEPYTSFEEMVADIFGIGLFPITYRLTNCTAPDAPSEASIGSTVTVPFVFPDGYGIVNNENVYVTNNGVTVPSTYSDGVLTFEMPNPN